MLGRAARWAAWVSFSHLFLINSDEATYLRKTRDAQLSGYYEESFGGQSERERRASNERSCHQKPARVSTMRIVPIYVQ